MQLFVVYDTFTSITIRRLWISIRVRHPIHRYKQELQKHRTCFGIAVIIEAVYILSLSYHSILVPLCWAIYPLKPEPDRWSKSGPMTRIQKYACPCQCWTTQAATIPTISACVQATPFFSDFPDVNRILESWLRLQAQWNLYVTFSSSVTEALRRRNRRIERLCVTLCGTL